MSRRGTVRRRCTKCGNSVRERSCPRCNSAANWSYTIDISRPGAKRRQRTRSGFLTKAEALSALTEVQASLALNTYVEPTQIDLTYFVERHWLDAIENTIRPSTFRSYRATLRNHVLPHVGTVRLQSITGADLNAMYTRLSRSGRRDGMGGLSPTTVRYVHVVLHRVLRDAVRWGMLNANPADRADPPRVVRSSEMATWTASELVAFLDSVRESRLNALWTLAATTGLRRGELLGLRWRDVDLDTQRLAVVQSLISVDYELMFSEPKTDRSRRSVALDSHTVRTLRAWRRRQTAERLRWGPDYEDFGLVFTRDNGSPLHPDQISKRFGTLIRKAGLRRIRLHDLRHTHATLALALAAGVHPKVVSERLGHSSVLTTLDTYSHAIPALQEDAADRVAELLFG